MLSSMNHRKNLPETRLSTPKPLTVSTPTIPEKVTKVISLEKAAPLPPPVKIPPLKGSETPQYSRKSDTQSRAKSPPPEKPQPAQAKQSGPSRLTVSLETSESAWHVAQAREIELMKWRSNHFGDPKEIADQKKQIREMLLTQIADREKRKHEAFLSSFNESMWAIDKDRRDISEQAELENKKKQALKQFSIDNKQLMELRWQRDNRKRAHNPSGGNP